MLAFVGVCCRCRQAWDVALAECVLWPAASSFYAATFHRFVPVRDIDIEQTALTHWARRTEEGLSGPRVPAQVTSATHVFPDSQNAAANPGPARGRSIPDISFSHGRTVTSVVITLYNGHRPYAGLQRSMGPYDRIARDLVAPAPAPAPCPQQSGPEPDRDLALASRKESVSQS